MKEFLIADETSFTKAIAYDERKFPAIKTDEALIITNAIKKSDGTVIITSKTEVFTTSKGMVVVPDDIRKEATKEKTISILDASLSPKKSLVTVKGKVVKASTACRKRLTSGEGEVTLKKIKLRDESGTTEVGLWRDMASTDVKAGDYLQLQNFYVTSRFHAQKKTQLPVLANQRKNSSIQFVPVSNDDLSSDCSDFEDDGMSKTTGTVVGIQHLLTYKACINARCLLKKLNPDNKCSICAVQYSNTSAGKGYVAKILVGRDGQFQVFTFFTQAMNSLLKSLDVAECEDLSDKLKEKLPIKIAYIPDGDKLKTLEAVN